MVNSISKMKRWPRKIPEKVRSAICQRWLFYYERFQKNSHSLFINVNDALASLVKVPAVNMAYAYREKKPIHFYRKVVFFVHAPFMLHTFSCFACDDALKKRRMLFSFSVYLILRRVHAFFSLAACFCYGCVRTLFEK